MRVHLIVEASGKGSPARTRFDFSHGGMTLGRAPTNDWVLDDPDHIISKIHCELRIDDAGLQVTDQSSNGVFLNGSFSPLGRGNSELLKDGDRLQIGEYVIRVEIEPTPEEEFIGSPFEQAGHEDLTEVLAPGAEAPPGGAPGQSSGAPLDTPFEDVLPVPGPDPLGLEDTPARGVSREPAAADHLPLDAHFMPPPKFEPVEGEAQPAPPEIRPGGGQLLPEDWDLTGALGPGDSAGGRAQGAGPEPDRADSGSPGHPPSPPPAWPGEPGTREAARPPPVTGARTAPPGESAARPGRLPDRAVDADLFAVFLDSAGIELDRTDLDGAQVARTSGILFRKMLDGLMLLLQARMVVKSEYQLERTLLKRVANNPLKSLPGVNEILGILFRPDDQDRAWLDADAAVDEAVEDLKAHDMALVAGMNAVVEYVVAALAPERFAEGGGKSFLSLSARRKARSWDRFTEEHAALRALFEEGLSGEARAAFERAYNREKQRLEGQGVDDLIG